MKDPSVRKKASVSASKKFERPEEREKVRQTAIKNWADGMYDGVRVGQCEWHELNLKSGETIRLQGTWELAYAKYMDENEILFEAHRGRLPYIDDQGVERSYYPDFRMADGSFIDVKNPLYEETHRRKLELVREQNSVVIRVVNRDEMERLGLL